MKPKTKKIQACLLLGCMLTMTVGCQSGASKDKTASVNVSHSGELVQIADAAIPASKVPATSFVKVPTSPGITVYANSKASIDASNANQGYVSVQYLGSAKVRIKVQVTKAGGTTYTYDLDNGGRVEVLPLTEGNGTYTIKIFENAGGERYAQAYSAEVKAQLVNDYIPFLYPNQYVDFNENSQVVKKAAELASKSGNDLETIANIYNYVINNVTYDENMAKIVQTGYLPNVDRVLNSGTGICFDYAALMTAMLRSQNIPTKLIIGYSGKLYHAWINTYIPEMGWVNNVIYFDGKTWRLMDPTFASSGKSSAEVMKYIGDGQHYQGKYSY